MKSAYHGLLVIDKPSGMTSRDVVDRVTGWFPPKTRLGHTGTLDPLATGILVVTVGIATRLAEYVQAMAKTYRTRIHLGSRSDTDDVQGNLEEVFKAPVPDLDTLARTIHEFIGEIDQVPPAFSAANVGGRRAYALARQGRPVTLQPRKVSIYSIQKLGYQFPYLDLEIHCGKGTYIRALARDLGQRLGCGGYVESLRRLKVGPFTEASALMLEADPQNARARMLPLSAAVNELPRVTLSSVNLRRLQNGLIISLPPEKAPSSHSNMQSQVAVFGEDNQFAAIATWKQDTLQPVKVFHLNP